MVRVKGTTRSKTSQRVNKDNNPSISVTGVNSEVEKHGKGNAHASCDNSNHDLEERCSENCLSDISKGITSDQLSKPCDGETNIISSYLNSTTFNNFVTDMKLNSLEGIECKRKGSLSSVEPLKTYKRRRKGFLQSVKPLKTYCKRRSGYTALGIRPLLIQNSLEIKIADVDRVHPVEKAIHYVDINMCQKEGDGESSNIAPDIVLEKDRDAQSHVHHIATESENFRSPMLPGSTCVMFTEEISDVATQGQSMELDLSEKSEIIGDETCNMLFAGNDLNKSTNDIRNGASLVERKHDNVEEASLVSSETMKQHTITQPGTTGSKLLPQEAPSGSIKKKLLVLDINGLLADIVSAENVSHECILDPDTMIGRKTVFKRPFCDEFLEFCFERFSVGIWSSRTKKNVDLVLNILMGKERKNLLFCWDQLQCTCTRYYTPENEDKPLFFKKLNKLWENSESDLPWKSGDYDESNTLLLDDSPYKALLNPPYTAIFPYTYQYSNERDNALGPDGDLRIYLEGLSMALNVQEYVKQNPYGQDPITENHESWSFYHEVIQSAVIGSLRNPYQSVCSEKLREYVSQVNSISVVAKSSKECLDINGTFKQLEAAESNRQLMENANADDNSTGSLNSTQRGCKRGRGSRSQSPRHEISGSRSHSLSPKICRRSKSPAPSHRSGFGGDKAQIYPTLHPECWDIPQGRCLRGASCRFVHHQSHLQSSADRRVQQHEGQILGHKPVPQECYAFIQGKCNRGASCRFLHSVPDKADLGMEGNEAQGKQLDNVRRDKPVPRECYDFIQGKCNWGASCRFLHSVPDKADLGMEGKETHGKQLDDVRRDKPVPRECYDYIQGKCNWGASCRFLHSVPNKVDLGMEGNEAHGKQLDDVRRDKPVPRECYDYIEGKCNWGASCRFLHSVPDKADLGMEGNETHGKQFDNVRCDKAAPRECYDFIQGKCKWGASCRFLHSVPGKADLGMEGNETHGKQFDNVRSDKAAPRECYDFIQGKCKRGGSCRFQHSVPGKADLCSGKNETHGEQLETIRKEAPRRCNDFIRGKCNWGASCRYVHSVPDKTDRINSFHNRYYQDVPSSLKASEDDGKAQTSSCNENSRSKELPEVCRNYTQGRCYRESYCHYLHPKSGATAQSGSTSQLRDPGGYKAVREVCWNHLQGRCGKGSDCVYLHQEPGLTSGSLSTSQLGMSRYKAMPEVCRNHAQGRCHKGPDCRYLHQEPDLTLVDPTSQLGETSRYKSLPEVCRNYTQGRCHKGLDCRFLHSEPGMSVGTGATRRFESVNEVCRNYIQGRCHKGSDCRYLHRESGVTVGSGSSGQFGETRRFKALPEMCRNYTQGRCHKGSDCRYLHQEPGYCKSPQQSFSHQSTSSTMLWNTGSFPGQCVNYTRGKCWRGVHCRYMHHEDVSSNVKSFGSCGDLKSIHHETSAPDHETSVLEHIESRTQESVPQFSNVDEGGTVEALPNQAIDKESYRETSIVPDDDGRYIEHLAKGVRVSMDNLGDSDQIDADNICHERSVHETTEPGSKELIPDFCVIEEQRGIVEALASHPIDSDSSAKASVVPEVDNRDERVPETVVCAPSTDNLGDSDRMMQDSDDQREQMSIL